MLPILSALLSSEPVPFPQELTKFDPVTSAAVVLTPLNSHNLPDN